MPTRPQAIIWNNDGLFTDAYASLGLNELSQLLYIFGSIQNSPIFHLKVDQKIHTCSAATHFSAKFRSDCIVDICSGNGVVRQPAPMVIKFYDTIWCLLGPLLLPWVNFNPSMDKITGFPQKSQKKVPWFFHDFSRPKSKFPDKNTNICFCGPFINL